MARNSLVKNSLFNMLYKGLTVLFPLITTSYISRVLFPSGVGKISYAQTIVNYFVTLASLGIPNYGVKVIAQTGKNRQNRSNAFYELFLINLISTSIISLIYYIIINKVDYFSEKQLILNLMGTILVLNIFNIDWFYQGIEEYVYIASRSAIIKIASIAIMFLCVRSKNDAWIYALILSTATAGNYIINMAHVRKYVVKKRDTLQIEKHMKPVLILLAASIATEIYTMLDTVMIEYHHGDEFVGYYSNAVKIVRTVYVMVVAMVTAFFPRISLYIKNGEKEKSDRLLTDGTMAFFVFAIPCSVGLFLSADYIVYILLGKAFLESVFTIRILSILVCVFSIAYFLGHMPLIVTGNEKKILEATIIGASLNVIFNYLLIPVFKHNGAAVASVVAECAVTISLLSHSSKYFKISIPKRYFGSIISAILGMVLSLECSRWIFAMKSIKNTLIIVAVSGFTYCMVLFFTKNPVTEMATQILENMIRNLKKQR